VRLSADFPLLRINHSTSLFVRALLLLSQGNVRDMPLGHFAIRGLGQWKRWILRCSAGESNMPTTTTKSQTKSDTVIALLDRAKGATLDEICKATNWQPHSARAFLTGLRKKGFELAREQRSEEGTSYRIAAGPSAEDASV
jgi:hypothetical protein